MATIPSQLGDSIDFDGDDDFDIHEEPEAISPPNADGSIQVSQFTLVCKLMGHIAKYHGGEISLSQRQSSVLIEAANLIVAEFAKPVVKAFPEMGLLKWLASDDTGLSSLAMAKHLCDKGLAERGFWAGVKTDAAIVLAQDDWQSHPSDPSDFGRCLRLLEAVPEFASHVPDMASLSPTWAAYVARWDELTALYREEFPTGSAPKLFDLMQQIQGDVRKQESKK